MEEKYIVYNNGSWAVREMENFFEEKGIPYTTIYKSSDRDAEILVPGDDYPYEEKNFSSLKSMILNGDIPDFKKKSE